MNSQVKQRLMLAAPSSGSGKTVITLGLLRALKNNGLDIRAAKAGPDFIDPGFHELSCGRPSVNLDPWAMTPDRIQALANAQQGSHLLVEAMMGLYDGAADGSGSASDLAKMLDASVVLIVDAAKQSHSIAALVRGFRDHDKEINFAGVILNKVGSARHETMLRGALESIEVPVLGSILRNTALALPERHLGLVQAGETHEIESFIENAGALITESCDLQAIEALFAGNDPTAVQRNPLPPLGQRIAIARDEAFSFIYPHLLDDWRNQGCEISFFSPLADEAPSADVAAIYLPGGYPELHAARIAAANKFRIGMQSAKDRNAAIYGECGGYMVLGEGLIDADGAKHQMLGLLKLETSFAKRKLHLGYRRLKVDGFVLGEALNAHEFHYTSAVREEGNSLFKVTDALGEDLGKAGLRDGSVMGSYMHVIDRGTS